MDDTDNHPLTNIPSPGLHAVLVTFRREDSLGQTLRDNLRAEQRFASFYVIDNGNRSNTRKIVCRLRSEFPDAPIEYVPSHENLGPAGGWAMGMELISRSAPDHDWILTLDDNNPPQSSDEIRKVFETAKSFRDQERQLGGVGIVGARFNWKTGLIERVPDSELVGAVPVDYLGGGHICMYSVSAIRKVGAFDPALFFGGVEVEFGLRLRQHGYSLIAHGELWHRRRDDAGRLNVISRPSKVCLVHWQKYYRIRNYIYMMRKFARTDLALRWAVIQCLAKPTFSFWRSPLLAWRGLRQALTASRDGFCGRMGRTFEPDTSAGAARDAAG